MKKIVISMIMSSVMLFAGNIFAAEGWKCRDASKKPICYVTSVQIRNGVYQSPGIQSGNKYVYFEYLEAGVQKYMKLKVGNYYVTEMSINATQALLMTALTTGLPIAWYGTDNSAWFVALGKPNVAITAETIFSDY